MIHTHLAEMAGRPANHQPKGYVNGQVLAAVSVLREKARTAYLSLRQAEQGAVDRALELGKALLDLRRAYPADIAYGQALRDLGVNQKTASRCVQLAELDAAGQLPPGCKTLGETGVWPKYQDLKAARDAKAVGQHCPTESNSCASRADESDLHGQHCPTGDSSCAPVGRVGTPVPVDNEDPYPYSDEQLAAMGRLPKGVAIPEEKRTQPLPLPSGEGFKADSPAKAKAAARDVVGQMTMDALYEAADRLHRLAERVSNCDVSDAMVRKLVALMDEIEGGG